MIWGVGTGRCGTRSAAELLGGTHEGEPRFNGEPIRWLTSDGGVERKEILTILAARMDQGVPAVVDHQHNYVIPLIREVDLDARFVWLVRHPIMAVSSFMASGWCASDLQPTTLMPSKAGWDGMPEIDRCIWYWLRVNELISDQLAGLPHFEVWRTDQMPAWFAKYGPSIGYKFDRLEARAVMEKTMAPWARYSRFLAGEIQPILRKAIRGWRN